MNHKQIVVLNLRSELRYSLQIIGTDIEYGSRPPWVGFERIDVNTLPSDWVKLHYPLGYDACSSRELKLKETV